MVNKKGWLRTIEVTIAVLLIIASILIFYQKQSANVTINEEGIIQDTIREMINNESLRYKIINYPDEAKVEIIGRMQSELQIYRINSTVTICSPNESCTSDIVNNVKDRDVSTFDVLVSTNINNSAFSSITPKKIRVYYWDY